MTEFVSGVRPCLNSLSRISVLRVCLYCIARGAFAKHCVCFCDRLLLVESGLFTVRHACFYPALRARLNLDHSHCLHMSLSGLEGTRMAGTLYIWTA
jgi:hypothetical protein